MKLVVNYDLMNEIIKANSGFDLKRFSSKMGIFIGVMGVTDGIALAVGGRDVSSLNIPFAALQGILIFGSTEVLLARLNKAEADYRLRNLASSLTKINIYTDSDALKEAKLYSTRLKVLHDGGVALKQDKYFKLRTTGSFNADQISLRQEHIIGTRDYELSIGEPNKVFSKVSSKALAR